MASWGACSFSGGTGRLFFIYHWLLVIEFIRWVCPLTPLEQWLRESGGAEVYSMGFLEHYLIPIICPLGLTPEIQITLGLVAIGLNLIVYGYVFLPLAQF